MHETMTAAAQRDQVPGPIGSTLAARHHMVDLEEVRRSTPGRRAAVAVAAARAIHPADVSTVATRAT
jgi:hypothetical protein